MSVSFQSLKDAYNACMRKQQEVQFYLEDTTRKTQQAKRAMQDMCTHEWEKDPPMYQTHSSYTCTICCKYR